MIVQTRHNHPVRLRLTPLHRRGIDCTDTTQPPRQAAPDTLPQERNDPPLPVVYVVSTHSIMRVLGKCFAQLHGDNRQLYLYNSNFIIPTNFQDSMATYSTNEFKSGLKILLNGEPHTIVENEFVKPGKGQAFNRTKLKNLISGKLIDKTFKSGESVEAADVVDLKMNYLYNDGQQWHFMDSDSYEQYAVQRSTVEYAKQWIKEQDICEVTLYNKQPILVVPPNFVELRVIETEPGIRGDTVSGATKQATLETHAVIKVPLFVEEGDILKIDTRSGEYISRIKD